MKFPFTTTTQWLVALRVMVGLMLAAHGGIRLFTGSADDFGVFLTERGFPMGTALAWGITIFEIIGGITMALGYFRKWIALLFIVELIMGIILVHASVGWFVVGYTTGGMEYSVLLIICLIGIASTEK